MSTVVIGVGNSYRHDDGAALAVTARLREMSLPGVSVVDSDGEPSRLLDSWGGAELAVVVDAVATNAAAPGSVLRSDGLDGDDGPSATSSHAFDLVDTWALAGVLSRRPDRLIVYGIVGERFDPGPGLSASVTGAVEAVVASIADDVGR